MQRTHKPATCHSRVINSLLRHIWHVLFVSTLFLAQCDQLARFTHAESSILKPSFILIAPQSFKVPTDQIQNDSGQAKLFQYVAVINNIHNEKDNHLLRQQFPKLTLQVRDASSPITGQLYFEHNFDYFPPGTKDQHILLPINLDQVSPVKEQLSKSRSYSGAVTHNNQRTVQKTTQIIVSVRPHQLESGFGSDSIEFVSSIPISVEAVPSGDGQRSFGVVQTDKPVYKPDDKVLIRAFTINENLKPITKDEVRIQVKNPHKITVEEVRFHSNFSASRGDLLEPLFFDYTFTFPPEPMLGSWSVQLLHPDSVANDSTTFEVKEYVLPTYEIEFDSPNYILPNAQNIVGTITTKYNYGKPVQGKVHFKFGFQETPQSKVKYIARSSIRTVDPTTGRADYKLNTDKFKETDWFPSIAGSRFVVEATVIEMSTGHREVAQDNSCLFLSHPYRISFDESITDFKPGLSQQLVVKVYESQTLKPAPPGTLLVAEYHDQNGTVVTSSKSDDQENSVQVLSNEAYIDSSGRATFTVGPVRDNITTLLITVKWLNSTKNNQDSPKVDAWSISEFAIGHHAINKHESINGWISIINKNVTNLNVGDQYISDLLIRDAIVIPQKIYYMILSRGQIHSLNILNQDGLIQFTVDSSMMPLFRVVLFALSHDSVGLLSDSISIEVNQDLKCGLNLSYQPTDSTTEPYIQRPGAKGSVIVSGRYGDVVSLIGVDSAVYSMNNRSRLDSSRIIQRVKRLDTGCGFGGGKNNLDVFHNAGLMIFRDQMSTDLPDSVLGFIGSSCMTILSQFKHLEDIELGYSRPMFAALSHFGRIRSLDMMASRQKSTSRSARNKRDIEVESIIRRQRDPLHRSCCKLGTLEDLPQKRNCTVRARIVERYMRTEYRSCATVYLDCCRAVFNSQVLLGSMVSMKNEPTVERVLVTPRLQYADPTSILTAGYLDKIESMTLVRKDFRETWLFDFVEVNNRNGSAKLNITLPHSITRWTISALALNRDQPLCLASQPLRLITFQEIFLQVLMPYKVIQGEQLDLVVTVFNYSPTSQEVLVYIYGVEGICSDAEPDERSEKRMVRVEKHSSQSIIFPMIPLRTGKYPVKVLAITTKSNTSDIIERFLNVVPRGRPVTDETTFSLDPMNQQRRSKRAIQTGNLLDEIDSLRGLQRSKIRLTPTREAELIVPQTQECIVSAIGDRMGQSVQTTMLDVENLIRLPHGCGEQVMIYLGPTLYTTRYLKSIDKLSGDLRWKAIRYIQSGYKRILNYRKDNGAFSAFAKREPSIWLTAFIAKMLCQTERTSFVSEEIHVDKTIINTALSWLLDMQNPDTGTWIEMNPVYHREMLGGVLKENALTAFILVTLNECHQHSVELGDHSETDSVPDDLNQNPNQGGVNRLTIATQKAEQTLMSDWYKAMKERNPYVLALTSYALSFSRPREAVDIFLDLLRLAERSQSRNQLSWRGEYQIETASYALQALIELAPHLSRQHNYPSNNHTTGSSNVPQVNVVADAIAIYNFLSSKRSFSGAFESTQDTVVALEALSKLAQAQSSSNVNSPMSILTTSDSSLICNVTISNRVTRSIEFGKENSRVLQTFKLDSLNVEGPHGEMIDIITSGNGLGTMSVKLKYNVLQEQDELCRFDIDASIEEWLPKLNMTSGKKHLVDVEHGFKENIQPPPSETIEDDYFKTFDKTMLSELNLLDLNHNDHLVSTPIPLSKRDLLRTRRASLLDDIQNRSNNISSTIEDWTSKVVSSVKSKLPSWLSLSGNDNSSMSNAYRASPLTSAQSSRRMNTTRRSPQPLQAPIISQPTGIPTDAKLNPLGLQLSLLANETSSNTTSKTPSEPQRALTSSSRKLVLLLKVCVHHMNSRRDSEMAVLEIGILSGFRPNEPDLKEILNVIGTPAMKYELSSDKSLLIIYLQYIPSSGVYCLQFRLIRDSLVYNLQSGYIRAYEYYSPTHSCASYYTPTRQTDLISTKCDSTGQVCQCAAKSLCPASNKLLDLGEVHSLNATRARAQFIDLACSDRYDFVTFVRLKNVRNLEIGRMFKLTVKVLSDLKGNMTKMIEEQRQQKVQPGSSIRKPQSSTVVVDQEGLEMEDSDVSLDTLSLTIDSSCVRGDPLLIHLAHPNQWKQGGELMILFGKYKHLEKRFFKMISKLGASNNRLATFTSNTNPYPKPKPSIYSSRNEELLPINQDEQVREAQTMALRASFDDAQQLKYSLTLSLDKDSILHDLTYQAKTAPRDTINNLILWLELRARREKWQCSRPLPLTL